MDLKITLYRFVTVIYLSTKIGQTLLLRLAFKILFLVSSSWNFFEYFF